MGRRLDEKIIISSWGDTTLGHIYILGPYRYKWQGISGVSPYVCPQTALDRNLSQR
jgi:hypothetical protein